MRKLFFLMIISLSLKSFGTAQAPDYLLINKDTLKLHCNPLESYFEKNPIKEGLFTTRSSNLWRGYIAFFIIKNDKLVVENIYKKEYTVDNQGNQTEKMISIYKNIFGENQYFNCNFYNGVLICPIGEIKEYVHMGYSSIYENYKLIEIKEGIFQKEKMLTNSEFMELKVKHFQKFKQTDEYKKQFDLFTKSTKEIEKDLDKMLGGLSKEEKKRKKKNKYLYEKEKEMENIKNTENFLFLFISNNIKTIDIPNQL